MTKAKCIYIELTTDIHRTNNLSQFEKEGEGSIVDEVTSSLFNCDNYRLKLMDLMVFNQKGYPTER